MISELDEALLLARHRVHWRRTEPIPWELLRALVDEIESPALDGWRLAAAYHEGFARGRQDAAGEIDDLRGEIADLQDKLDALEAERELDGVGLG